jgi:hypothetical protein
MYKQYSLSFFTIYPQSLNTFFMLVISKYGLEVNFNFLSVPTHSKNHFRSTLAQVPHIFPKPSSSPGIEHIRYNKANGFVRGQEPFMETLKYRNM